MMRIKKTFDYSGTVKSATGLLGRRVIGKPVRGIITITGTNEDFDSPINRVFRVGGEVTEAPLVWNLFPGKNLKGDDYPYVLRSLVVNDSVETSTAQVKFSLMVVPWTQLDPITATGYSENWLYRILLHSVVVEGVAIFSKFESVPDAPKKR